MLEKKRTTEEEEEKEEEEEEEEEKEDEKEEEKEKEKNVPMTSKQHHFTFMKSNGMETNLGFQDQMKSS